MNSRIHLQALELLGEAPDLGVCTLSGSFRDAAVEAVFRRQDLPWTHRHLRLSLSFCASFYLLFALTDVAALGYTQAALFSFLARVFVVLAALGGMVWLRRRPQSVRVPVTVATTVEIVGMAAFMVVVLYRPAEVPWHAMSMSIMLIVVYLFIPNAFINAAGVASLSTLVFGLLVVQIGSLTNSDLITMGMLLILANAFGIVAARRYQQLRRQEFGTQAALRRLSVRDPLTGCFNRRHLQQHLLEREVERASRYPAWLTVVMCDLDHFKRVNDTYGHVVGDAVLKRFAALLQKLCREHVDSVIRYGGEEFLLLLPETDLAGGLGLAERLRAELAERPIYGKGEQTVTVSASFGVAAVDFASGGLDVSPQALVAAADDLLYRAKRAGRNRVESAEYVPASPVLAGHGEASEVVANVRPTMPEERPFSTSGAVAA